MRYKFSISLIFLFVSFLSFSQVDNNEVLKIYNSSVLDCNCATLKLVHQDAGRNDVASNLNCNTFEAILASIPSNEKSTTYSLSKKIEDYQKKYADEDLTNRSVFENALDDLIKYCTDRINAKERSVSTQEFENAMVNIKLEALQNFDALETITPNTVAETPQENTSKSDSTFWFLISVIVSIIALAFSLLAFIKKSKVELGDVENSYLKGKSVLNSMSPNSLEELEEKLKNKIKQNYSETIHRIERLDYLVRELKSKLDEKEQDNLNIEVKEVVDEIEHEINTIQENTVFETEEDIEEEIEIDSNTDYQEFLNLNRNVFFYAPLAQNGFLEHSTLNAAVQDNSVFEVEINKNNPEEASFSFLGELNDLNTIIGDPITFLYPFADCFQEIDPDQEYQSVIVLQPGMLIKQNEIWVVTKKIVIELE